MVFFLGGAGGGAGGFLLFLLKSGIVDRFGTSTLVKGTWLLLDLLLGVKHGSVLAVRGHSQKKLTIVSVIVTLRGGGLRL